MLVPKLFTTLRGYDRGQFAADAVAGVIVGVVALPLAIAFAIASGVTPERGLHTAIIAGFLISALGGSRVQIGGPTGAFVVIVYGIVQRHGMDGLLLATMMAGVLVMVLGLARLGGAIKFIPYPVITGFTSGIAVLIASSQVRDLLGLDMGPVPADFLEKLRAYAAAAGLNPATAGIGMLALAILIVWPRVSRRVPAPLVALLVTTALVHGVGLDVETIGSRFGAITASFPTPRLPPVSVELVRELSGPAFTIAMLAAIESLLSAVVADGMIGGRHRSNMELVAQGVANIASPLFGGIPATGAIARTATNIRNGGRTPVAGIVHALTLLAITLFLGRWAGLIPFATLAAILLVVAYHMSEWRAFAAQFRAPAADLVVMLVTFALTVVVDLTVAIQVGMVLAAFLFMKRMAEVTDVRAVTREFGDPDDGEGVRRRVPEGVEVYEINGPFFFGAAQTFREQVEPVLGTPRVLILRLRDVPVIDATGIHALRDVVRRSRQSGTRVLLADVRAQPMMALARAALLDELGDDAALTMDDALRRAAGYVAGETQPI